MKKLISLIIIVALLFSMAGCGTITSATEKDANKYLTDFFASYTKMKDYLASPNIALSSYQLDGEGIDSILKAAYQAGSVSFSFPMPEKVSDSIFRTTVEVAAPDMAPLLDMYTIDRNLSDDILPDGFVAQSFYDNIRAGTTRTIKQTVIVVLSYNEGVWTVNYNNDLANAIFPNLNTVE